MYTWGSGEMCLFVTSRNIKGRGVDVWGTVLVATEYNRCVSILLLFSGLKLHVFFSFKMSICRFKGHNFPQFLWTPLVVILTAQTALNFHSHCGRNRDSD